MPGREHIFQRFVQRIGNTVLGRPSVATSGLMVWQRSYCEHVIRNERLLGRIREYTLSNPE